MSRSVHFADGDFGFGALLALVVRQFWVIALVVMVGSLSALAYGHQQAPSFDASAVVQIRQGAAFAILEARLTSRDNLAKIAQRHQLSDDAGSLVALRRAVAMHDLTSAAGQTLGFAPETTGLVISVRMPHAEMAAQIANDLAQQVLDLGNEGHLDDGYDDLLFYRGEEGRLWQEVGALRAEIQALVGTVAETDEALATQRRLDLLEDQYSLVRQELAKQEVAARLDSRNRAGQFSQLQRATSADAVSIVQSFMVIGVAGSLLLAVTLAFVLERRYPALQRAPWNDYVALRAKLRGGYRMVDDPKRPILGLPRFVVVAGFLVALLIGVAALIR